MMGIHNKGALIVIISHDGILFAWVHDNEMNDDDGDAAGGDEYVHVYVYVCICIYVYK